MATSTTNYNLRKPASSDNVNVKTDIADNMDIIDGTMKSISDVADAKSAVSVSATGTATDEVKYITIDGVEKKLPESGASYDLLTLVFTLADGTTETHKFAVDDS